jgi:multidrug/hemolysin transport system ATP-binding protein
MQDIISVRGLTKRYGELVAVDNVSFQVHEGSLFAFLGPNGAGKSTTINVICTLLGKTDGEVTVDSYSIGRDDAKIRKKIGVVFQDNVLDELLTVKENLMTRGQLYGFGSAALHKRLSQVAETMNISDILNRRYGKLSGGQRRRCEIGRALMSDPKILFLDEPTTGLDPQTRITVWKTIRQLQKDTKMTVFLTTHYMEEAAGADWVAVIDGGRIVAEGTPHELKEKYSTDLLRLTPNDRQQSETWLTSHERPFERQADQLLIPVKDSLEALKILHDLEGSFSAFEVVSGNMDDVFINITGHRIREDN